MKSTGIAVLIGIVLMGGAVVLSRNTKAVSSTPVAQSNTTITEGKQIITIAAKGGYSPRQTSAKADTPTVIRIQTAGTFDCSSTLTIPSLNYQKNLPASGITDIELPPQPTGSTVEGICSMGMYRFAIAFH